MILSCSACRCGCRGSKAVLLVLGGLERFKFKADKVGSLVIPGFEGGYVEMEFKEHFKPPGKLSKREWKCLSLSASVLVSLIKRVVSVKSSSSVWIDLNGLNNPSVEKGLGRGRR